MSERIPTARIKRLQAQVRRQLLDNAMVPRDGRILVAVSGGPDSTALLVLLARLTAGQRLYLHAAHYDHGLRGRAAAKREARQVQALADSLGIPLTLGQGDVRAVVRAEKLSTEQAARRERYAFLARTANETGCHAVAMGHTASDQAETVLLHLIRGSGLAGLAGMAPVSPWPFPGNESLRLLRPLLRVSRKETLACCEDAGLTPVEDESNASPRFRRNRVRNEVLPLLAELNPRIEEALVRLADAAADDHAFIQESARDLLRRPTPKRGQRLSRRNLSEAPTSLRRQALRMALGRAAGDLQEFGERHLTALERLVLEGKTGDRLDLPRELTAELRRRNLYLGKATANPTSSVLPAETVTLSVPGFGRFGSMAVSVTSAPPPAGTWAEVDASAIGTRVEVRRRADGDRFHPLGMQASKKLQDFLVDAHVPRSERDRIPLFESERGIVWVGGLRIAEWARPRPGEPTLFLSYEQGRPDS